MLLPDPKPLKAGAKYAETAGVLTGSREHTHFVFRIIEECESYGIDPWILFWQMFRDNREIGHGPGSESNRRTLNLKPPPPNV